MPTISIPDHVTQGSVAELMQLGWVVPVTHIIKHEISKLFMVGDFGKRGQSIAIALVNVARFDESLSYKRFGSDDEDDADERDEDQPAPETSTRSEVCPVYMASLDDRYLCYSACTSVLARDGLGTSQLTPLMVLLLDVGHGSSNLTAIHVAPQTKKKEKRKKTAQDCEKLHLTEAIYQGCSNGRVEVIFSSWKGFLRYPSEQAWRDASGFADELSLKVFLKPAAQGFGLAVGLALPTIITATGSEYVAEPSWLLFTAIHFSIIYAIDLDVFSSTYSVIVAFFVAVFSWTPSDSGDVFVLEFLLVLMVCLIHSCRVLSQDPMTTLGCTLSLRLVVTIFYRLII